MPKGKEKAVSEADLIKAIKQNKPAAMSKLLKSGGNPNAMIMPAENKPGDPYREPLIVCAAQILASGIMLTTLIKAKADVDKQDSVGGTALMAAATVGEVESMRVLLAAGANIDKVTLQNETALFHACGHGQPDCARFLLEQKADIELGSASRVTPLMIATQNGNAKTVQILLEFDANLNAVDGTGRTALDMADHHLDHDTKKWVRPEIEKKLKQLSLDKEIDAKLESMADEIEAKALMDHSPKRLTHSTAAAASAGHAHSHQPSASEEHAHLQQPSASNAHAQQQQPSASDLDDEEERIVDVTDEVPRSEMLAQQLPSASSDPAMQAWMAALAARRAE
jgi:ankyrin repeat protein